MSVVCNICKKEYSSRSTLNRHLKDIHDQDKISPVGYDTSVGNYKCQEENCNITFKKNCDLIDHLTLQHGLNIDIEKTKFRDMEEFYKWKNRIEEAVNCNYVVSNCYKSKQNGLYIYYNCNRSGKVKTKPTNCRKRLTKKQGSCKLNKGCTSQIKLFKLKKIYVTWIKTHYGHSAEVKHNRLPRKDRCSIASQLISGVSPATILDTYRKRISKDLKRVNLLTINDIHNIRRAFGTTIPDGIKHKDDAISADLCDMECASNLKENPAKRSIKNNSNNVGENHETHMKVVKDITTEGKDSNINEKLMFKVSETFRNLEKTKLNLLEGQVASQIMNHLNAIDSLLTTLPNQTRSIFQSKSNECSNKKVEVQFCSMANNSNVQKPSKNEVVSITNSLKTGQDLIYISKNWKNDHKY